MDGGGDAEGEAGGPPLGVVSRARALGGKRVRCPDWHGVHVEGLLPDAHGGAGAAGGDARACVSE